MREPHAIDIIALRLWPGFMSPILPTAAIEYRAALSLHAWTAYAHLAWLSLMTYRPCHMLSHIITLERRRRRHGRKGLRHIGLGSHMPTLKSMISSSGGDDYLNMIRIEFSFRRIYISPSAPGILLFSIIIYKHAGRP